MLVLGGVVLVAVVLALAGRPAESQAYGEISLEVTGDSAGTMPDGVLLHIAVSPSASVTTAVWDSNSNFAGGCSGNCDVRIMTGVHSATQPVTKTFAFKAAGPNQTDSAMVYKTVTVNPPDWQVSLDMPSGVTMPDPIPVSFGSTPSVFFSQGVNLINADTNQWAWLSCATNAGSCSGNIGTGWLGGLPVRRHYRAELKDGDTTLASVTKGVTIFPPSLGVEVKVPLFVLPGQAYKVKVINTYNQWTPYTIEVRDGSGTLIGTCAVDQSTCEFTRTAGAEGGSQSFTATVTYGSDVVSQTSSSKVAFTDPATASTNDGVSVAGVAALFGSTGAVCDALLHFPGSHLENTSTSDQENACLLASEVSGASVEDVIRAALAAMAAAGIAVDGQSLLAWLLHYIWENGGTTWPPGHPPPPRHPTTPPTSTPVPVASAVEALAGSLTARNAAVAALGAAAATELARQCLNLTSDEALSFDLCKTLPIFVPGTDYPTATAHRVRAIASWPAWALLHRSFKPRTRWQESQTECQDKATGYHCDEFPEQATLEGGNPAGTAKRRPSLDKTVTEGDNTGLGGKLSAFLGRRTEPNGCKVPNGGKFLVIPLPVPTQTAICNFPVP